MANTTTNPNQHSGRCLLCDGPLNEYGVCVRCASVAAGRAMTDCYFYPREVGMALALLFSGLLGFVVVGWLVAGESR